MRVWAGVACAVGALLLAGVGGAAPRQSFNDPVGDTTGPDIDTVALEVSGANFVIDVHLANRQGLDDEDAVEVDVDLDGNPNTGDESGVDLYGLIEGNTTEVAIWQQDDFVDTTKAHVSFDNGVARLTVPLSLVGLKANVSATAIGPVDPMQPDVEPTDDAPNTGAYSFTFPTLTVRGSSVSFAPAQPQAGKLFKVKAVVLQVSGLGAVKAEYTCTATLGGKKLAPPKRCAWKLPKTSKGSRLRVAIVATFEGRRFPLPAKTFVVR